MQRRQFCLAPLCMGVFGAGAMAEAAVTPKSADGTGVAPLRIPVWIDEFGPLSFIVDTAASRTVIAAHLLSQLGARLVPGETVRLEAMTGEINVPQVAVTSVRAGDTTLGLARLPVLPRHALASADGLLGADAFAGRVLTLEFNSGKADLSSSDRADAAPREATARTGELALRRETTGRAFVAARLGRQEVVVLLDTAALRSIARPGLIAADQVVEASLRGADGTLLAAREGRLPTLRLGAAHWPAGPVLVAPIPAGADVLLGLDRLGDLQRLTIDYAHRQLSLSPPRRGRE